MPVPLPSPRRVPRISIKLAVAQTDEALLQQQRWHSQQRIHNKIMSEEKKIYAQDGPEAVEIAKYLPYFPFKGIPRFYDIGGFLAEPAVFQKIVDIFAERYAGIGIDSVAG